MSRSKQVRKRRPLETLNSNLKKMMEVYDAGN